MITKLFLAFGVQTINSQAFAKGYYYEYSLEDGLDGERHVTRRLCNRYEFSNAEPATAVESDEQLLECTQAVMYNFPYAFNADGSVAIDLPELHDPIASDKADAGHLDGAEADKERQSELAETAAGADSGSQTL